MIRRVVAYVLLTVALLPLFPYGVSAPLVCVVFVAFIACVLVAVAVPSVRRSHATLRFKRFAAVLSVVVVVLWLVSVVAYVRVPYGQGKAWSVGYGNIIRQWGVSFEGNPLAFTARWAWSGFAAGQFGSGSASWLNGRVANAEYWAVWPLVVAVVMPTAILWVLDTKRYPSGACQACGYNLTGLPEPRCPECGKASNAKLEGGSAAL